MLSLSSSSPRTARLGKVGAQSFNWSQEAIVRRFLVNMEDPDPETVRGSVFCERLGSLVPCFRLLGTPKGAIHPAAPKHPMLARRLVELFPLAGCGPCAVHSKPKLKRTRCVRPRSDSEFAVRLQSLPVRPLVANGES